MQPSTAAMFGEWRELLQSRPSRERWARLCELLLEAWLLAPHAITEQWLPYAHAHLPRWPEAVRSTPSWALDFMIDANALHLLELVGCVEVEGMRAYETLRTHSTFSSLPISAFTLRDEVFSTWSGSIIAQDPRLQRLERFSLIHAEHDAGAWKKLVDSDWTHRLRELHIHGLEATRRAHGLGQAFEALDLQNLESLILRDIVSGYMSLYYNLPARFLRNDSYEHLKHVEIWHLPIARWNAAVSDGHRFTQNLETLYLHQAALDSSGWEEFIASTSTGLDNLEELHLERCDLLAHRLKPLLELPWFLKLKRVKLRQVSLFDEQYEMLLDAARSMPALRELDLARNTISDEIIIALSNHDGLANLTTLNIDKRFGKRPREVFDALASSATLPNPLRQAFADAAQR